jgi:hypothetical protein
MALHVVLWRGQHISHVVEQDLQTGVHLLRNGVLVATHRENTNVCGRVCEFEPDVFAGTLEEALGCGV